MRAEMYALHEAHEEAHWWFSARRRIVMHLLRRELRGAGASRRLLDVGCGAGGLLAYLRAFGDVVGVDPSPDAVAFAAQKRSGDVRLGRLPDEMPLGADDRFDVITLLDVLEHIDEDDAALRTLHGLLKPNGLLLLTVPAFQFLWSGHDVVNEHKRRYTSSQLRERLHSAGFHVEILSYYNTTLFAPVAVIRFAKRWLGGVQGQGDLGAVPRPLNAVLRAIFAAERHVLGAVRLPFGVSLIATARVRNLEGAG